MRKMEKEDIDSWRRVVGVRQLWEREFMHEKMNPEVKKRWIEALLSGEYKQGRGSLCKLDRDGEERFCCLGVLADIEFDGYWELDEEYGEYRIEDRAGSLSYEFRRSIKLSPVGTLISMNDMGRSFKEIALWIEKNL